MIVKYFAKAFVLALILLSSSAWAQSKDHIQLMAVSKAASNQSSLSIAEIVETDNSEWQLQTEGANLLSLTPGVNWFKVQVTNGLNRAALAQFLLDTNFEVIDVALYSHSPILTPLPLTLLANHQYSGKVQLTPNTRATLYLKVNTEISAVMEMHLLTPDAFIEQQRQLYYTHGFVVGGIVFVGIVFALLFLAIRDTTLGYLSAYFIARAGLLSVLLGGHLLFLFPEQSALRGADLPILAVASSIFYILFTARLFNLAKVFPNSKRVVKAIVLSLVAYALISAFLPVHINVTVSATILTSVLVGLVLLGYYLYIKRQRLAVLFFTIMLAQLLFTVVIVLGYYIDIPAFSQRDTLHITSFSLNTLLIVFLICRLYFYQMRDKQQAQKEALANAIATKQAQEKLIQLQDENQEELEQRVQERTLELHIALSELEELNRELAEKNTTDDLTGLFNRRYYDQKIVAEYRRSKRNLTPLSLVVADLDFFKQVNDNYGHLAGDQCLSWLAQHIKQSLKRSADIGCRYGGEEFCLILPDTDAAGAFALAEELRAAVEGFDFVYQEQHLSLTISCGVATYQQQDGVEPEHIFCAADKALYQAKRNGRNQVQVQEISCDLSIQENSND
ncbi:MAG: hypothetical protein CL811_03895 [Colwelliaceae bacterium]|nr:hypothetical protein [Colwelliaceae bacterium]